MMLDVNHVYKTFHPGTINERRALAVERESQISENEMQSKLDLARKRADLVAVDHRMNVQKVFFKGELQ